MKVLFTGVGKAGSWTMRGAQMASARAEWKAVANATREDAEGMDVVIIVKRIEDESLRALKAWNGPLVYDPLDFWPRRPPIWSVDEARLLVRPLLERIDPDLILCPVQQMADEIALLGWETRVLYHHYDPRLQQVGIEQGGRRRLVYHGEEAELGWWKRAAQISCFLHGAEFVISNGPWPAPGDAMLAVRRSKRWISRRWKSNVKAAVALKLGIPFVAWPEPAYFETHPSAFWFRNIFEMHRAIGKALASDWAKPDERFSLDACAGALEIILEELLTDLPSRRTAAARPRQQRRFPDDLEQV